MADGLARAGFDVDLKHGQASESDFVRAVSRAQVENKDDGWTPATGNVAIEYAQRGRPSGIVTTTADYWAIEIQDDVWIVIRTTLLRVAVAQALAEGRTKLIGDQGRYQNALVPIEWLWRGTPPPSLPRPA